MRSLALLIAIVCAWSPAARAETPEQARARVLYADGRREYEARNYAKAIVAWKEGFGLSDAPMFLFNIGQAYRFSGDCARALEHYAKYRAALPSPPNAEELAAAEAMCPAFLRSPAPPAVSVGFVAVPKHPNTSTMAAHPGRGRTIAVWSIGGAGVVAIGVGLGFFGARSWSRWNDIEKLCGDDRQCDDSASLAMARSFEVDARRDGTRSTWLVVAGAAALGTATILHLTRPHGVTIAPQVETNAVSMIATRSF